MPDDLSDALSTTNVLFLHIVRNQRRIEAHRHPGGKEDPEYKIPRVEFIAQGNAADAGRN